MIRWWSMLGAAGVFAGARVGGLSAPGIATACACGGVLSHDVTTRVADEVALETTTLSVGSPTGVQEWLTAHGYVLRQEISDGLDPYLREGWSVVAMRTSTTPLNGPLAPVKLTFASDRLVYPMRRPSPSRPTTPDDRRPDG